MEAETITIEYNLRLLNGDQKRHVVHLDGATMALRNLPPAVLPEWTRLAFHQCSNCPLNPDTHSHCPVAVGLVEVIESFKDGLSHEVAEVAIRTPHRTYVKKAPLQQAVSSLMGLHMASSGCPILDKLRPMVSTHLPFASIEETLYRAVSMYLLAQYVRSKRGLTPDWELRDLVANYEAVSLVNAAFVKRILNINTLDANLNALVSLDCFAGMASISIAEDYLKEIEPLFEAYVQEGPAANDSAA
jgi:hypothetical protein